MSIVNLLFFIIIIISFYQGFIVDKTAYSINKFVWIYVLIFWGIAPFIQYRYDDFPWNATITESSALKANVFIVIWILFYRFIYRRVIGSKYLYLRTFSFPRLSINNIGMVILISIQVFIFIFFYIKHDGLVFIRSGFSDQLQYVRYPTALVVETLGRSISAFITVVFAFNYRSNKSIIVLGTLLVSMTLLLLTSFPLAIARFMAGSFYVGLIFLAKPIYKIRNIPFLAMILAMLLIYPLVSTLRYKDIDISSIQQNARDLTLVSGDYDNFSALNITINYVEKYSFQHGNQMLGWFFFFIPRSIWMNKPISSGQLIAESYGLSFTNISCPIVAEGYLDYGIVGIIIFAIIFGGIIAKIDKYFYLHKEFTYIKLLYPSLLGMVFFLLRGSLITSYSFAVSLFLAAFIVFRVSLISSGSKKGKKARKSLGEDVLQAFPALRKTI